MSPLAAKKRRRARPARHQVDRRLTRAHARRAAAHGAEVRRRQAAVAGRALPASRDDTLSKVVVTTRLVREAAKVIDRDRGLVDWLADKLAAAQAGAGRPGHLSLRSALICFWLLNVTQRNFHVVNLPALLANLSPRVRRQLGVDYLDRRGQARQVSYGQLLRVFTNIADAFDPFDPRLDEEEARARAADLQELVNRLVRASVDHPGHRGDYAVDATLVWSWDRPPGGGKGKVERRGRDGDAGRPLALSEVVGLEDVEEGDLTALGFVADPLVALRGELERAEPVVTATDDNPDAFFGPVDGGEEVQPATPPRRRPRKTRRRTWGRGSAWVGRGRNKAKSVHGYALHTATPTDPDAPPVIEALAVTPAPALPALAVLPLLRHLADTRAGDERLAELLARPGTKPLGKVVADPAYSANATQWQLPIRALGGSAVFRLHATNQAGRRATRGHTFVDGRPYCSCIPDAAAEVKFPKFPYTGAEMEAYQLAVLRRQSFEMLPNGAYRPNGSRQFRTPHYDPVTRTGGCEHCVDAFGNAVVDPETGMARPRCCTQRTHTFSAEELGLYQDEPFGEEAWYAQWNPRNRVEGTYGVMKSLATVNWGHDYHHFVGLARESLVATFATMAHNFHVQRTFAARLALLAERPARPDARPSAQPTQTTPAGLTAARRAREAQAREAAPRGPKGLEFLGRPRAGP